MRTANSRAQSVSILFTQSKKKVFVQQIVKSIFVLHTQCVANTRSQIGSKIGIQFTFIKLNEFPRLTTKVNEYQIEFRVGTQSEERTYPLLGQGDCPVYQHFDCAMTPHSLFVYHSRSILASQSKSRSRLRKYRHRNDRYTTKASFRLFLNFAVTMFLYASACSFV